MNIYLLDVAKRAETAKVLFYLVRPWIFCIPETFSMYYIRYLLTKIKCYPAGYPLLLKMPLARSFTFVNDVVRLATFNFRTHE